MPVNNAAVWSAGTLHGTSRGASCGTSRDTGTAAACVSANVKTEAETGTAARLTPLGSATRPLIAEVPGARQTSSNHALSLHHPTRAGPGFVSFCGQSRTSLRRIAKQRCLARESLHGDRASVRIE